MRAWCPGPTPDVQRLNTEFFLMVNEPARASDALCALIGCRGFWARVIAVGANGSGKTNFFNGASCHWCLSTHCLSVVSEGCFALGLSLACTLEGGVCFLHLTRLKTCVVVVVCFCAAAIRFVLSDFTTQLRAEDRQRLLHVRARLTCNWHFLQRVEKKTA